MNHHSQNSHRPNHGDAARNARTFTGAILAVLLSTVLHATGPSTPAKNLGDLSLEELMNETVTSVSKKEQPLFDSAAAIAVLSNDELRRSGATNLTEALRLLPGMEVGSINASQTAISARGFGGLYANKLLVLVDGRAVYSPNFGGVYWDLQQPMLEDVDRIEVIRGPGATLWGANAVNGVINVVTRSARETQGGLLYGGGGARDTMGGARYGGRSGEHTYFRVYGSGQSQDNFPQANGQPAPDAWSSRQGGFRIDHYPDDATQLTWQGDATFTDLEDHRSDASNLNTLARWTRTRADRSTIEAQVYYDRTARNDSRLVATTVDTFDANFQRGFSLSERHTVIGGLGFRFISGDVRPTSPEILVLKDNFTQRLYSAFLQDEIKLLPDRLTLTVGTKIEHNDYTGFEFQPSASLLFKPAENQTLWTAVSRAVRTPAVMEGRDVVAILYGAPFAGPDDGLYIPTLTGNPRVASEKLLAYELGWRIQPGPRVRVDATLFYSDYRDLITYGSIARLVPGVPVGIAEMPWANSLSGHTYGGEGAITLTPTDHWRLIASYSLFLARIKGPADSVAEIEEDSPRHQASLRLSYDFNARLSLDGQCRYVGAIRGVPAYVTADLRLSYRTNERIELSLAGRNLLDHQHPEQANVPFSAAAEVPRGYYGRITWRY